MPDTAPLGDEGNIRMRGGVVTSNHKSLRPDFNGKVYICALSLGSQPSTCHRCSFFPFRQLLSTNMKPTFGTLPALLHLLTAHVAGEEIAFYCGPDCTGRPDGVVNTHQLGKCYSVPVKWSRSCLISQTTNMGSVGEDASLILSGSEAD